VYGLPLLALRKLNTWLLAVAVEAGHLMVAAVARAVLGLPQVYL
jgi:hypothetical protein